MPTVTSNGLNLEYDRFGDPAGPPVLLIAGLGSQLIAWDEEFCALLVGGGAHVIRVDNRDTGRSTWLDDLGVPVLPAVRDGLIPPPYTLADMAADAVGLLDGLGLAAAHVVGMSLGGYVAQLVATEHPDRVLSLTSIMSSTSGADAVPGSFTIEPPTDLADPAAFVEMRVAGLREISGPHFDETRARALLARMLERGVNISGRIRQAAAGVAAPSRLVALSQLSLPVLVVHGDTDTRIPLENGIRTAGATPGSRLLVVPEMGHELPAVAWPVIATAILELVHRRPPVDADHGGVPSAESGEVCVQTVVPGLPDVVSSIAAELAGDQDWGLECCAGAWAGPATVLTISATVSQRSGRPSDGPSLVQRRISTVRDVVDFVDRLRPAVRERSPA